VRTFFEDVAGVDNVSSPLRIASAFGPLLSLALEDQYWGQQPNIAIEFVKAYLRDERADRFQGMQLQTALQGRLGRYGEMLQGANELVRLRQRDSNAHAWRGLAHLLGGDSERSLNELDRAGELDRTSAWVLAFRGLALAQSERVVEAISAFDDAVQLEPDLVVALLGRASGRAALGNTAGAIADLTHVLEIEPDDPDVLALRGDRYVELNEYGSAQSDYQRAMDLAGQTSALLVRYLFALSQQRGPAGSEDAATRSTGDAEVETDTIDRSSTSGSLLNRFFPDFPLRHRKRGVARLSAGSASAGPRFAGLRNR
jgi:tetratricopeptide (TPR) repeat protein